MRHIAIIICFGALLQGCSENRSKEVSTKSTRTIHKTTAIVPAKTPVRKQAVLQRKTKMNSKSAMINDKVTTGRAAPSIQPQKKPLRAMTYNEAQFSDDASDYPATLEAQKLEKEKYNQ